MADEKDGNQIGERTKAYREAAPELVAEIVRHFRDHKDLNSRAKDRLSIKSILDFLSVDTEYPKQPAIPVPGRAGMGRAVPAFPDPMEPMGAIGGFQERMAPPGGVRPIPGAHPINNDDILG